MQLTIEQMQQRAELAEKRLRFLEQAFSSENDEILKNFGIEIMSKNVSDSFVMVIDKAIKRSNFS